jgi:hypothetical protein
MLRCGGCVSAIELNHLDPPRLDGCANPILNLSWPPAAHRICGDCRLRFLFAGGPWVRPSPGIPYALSFPEGQNLCKTRARGAAGKLILVLTKLFDTLHRKIGAMSRFLPRGEGDFVRVGRSRSACRSDHGRTAASGRRQAASRISDRVFRVGAWRMSSPRPRKPSLQKPQSHPSRALDLGHSICL